MRMLGSTSSATAISTMRFDSASERPNVGCAVSTIPVRARSQRALKVVEVGRRGGAFDVVGELLVGRAAVDEADALAQVTGALDAGAVHQTAGKCLQLREGDVARFKAARQIEGEADDGIERRGIRNLRAQGAKLITQLELVELPGCVRRCVFLHRSLHASRTAASFLIAQFVALCRRYRTNFAI